MPASLGSNLRYTVRALRKAPTFTLTAVLTFAIGIGANAMMFGIVDRLLLRPPAHVRDPKSVVRIGVRWQEKARGEIDDPFYFFSYPAYKALRDHATAFSQVALSTTPQQFPVGRGAEATRAMGSLVSASYFATLGVSPALGRFFVPEEDVEPTGVPVAVISHGFWQRHFAGAPNVIGRTFELGARSFTVIGVAPRGFTGLWLGAVDTWIPITAGEGLRFAGSNWSEDQGSTWVHLFARLRPGTSLSAAAAGATTAFRSAVPSSSLARAEPSIVPQVVRTAWVNDRGNADDDIRVAALLAGVAGLVLLIACANVANLMLARALRRRREVAVRLALGAARGRLVAQLLTESLVLATVGGLAALVVAAWGGNLLRSVFFGDVLWNDALLDTRVMWFAATATVLTAALSGLVPALQASAPNLAATLKAGAREGGGQRSRTRASLLVIQSTLAAILLVGTGLFVRSLRNVHAVPTGMRADRVLMSSVALRGSEYTRSEVDALYARMAERARSVPGVASVAVSLTVPFASSWGARVIVPGRDSVPGAYVNAVSPGFFETIGTRLLAGRDFTPVDDAAAPTIVISARAARRWWPDGDAVGRCVHLNADSLPCLQVIGIAEDVRKETVLEAEDDVLQVYVPLGRATANMSQRILLVRAGTPDVVTLMEPLRRAIQVAAVNLPYVDVRPLSQLLDGELRPWRLGASMFGAFGLIAALLTCLGIYGVVSYTAAQRTHEMGVRMALGARAPDVLVAVAGDGMHVSLRGAALGVVLALLLQGLVEPLLFGVSAFDPVVLGGVAGLLALVAALGSVVPAWRATRVDPVLALRSE